MGIVARQSILNLIIIVIGVILGAVNIIFLYPLILSDAEFGLTRILASVAILASSVGALGTSSTIIKYLPFYKDSRNSKMSLLRYSFGVALIGMLLVFLGLVIAKPVIISSYSKNAAMFGENYLLLLPLIFLIISNGLLSSYCKGLLKSVFQSFLNDVGIRIVHFVLLILHFYGVIDFTIFLYGFIGAYSIVSISLIIYLLSIDELSFKTNDWHKIDNKREMLAYGGANFLTGLAGTLTNRIDALMITAMVGCALCTENTGLIAVAMYSWAQYVVTMVELPSRAISGIAAGFISEAWKKNDLSELAKLYRSSSITQMVVGILFFLGIWLNVDLLYLIAPDYAETRWVIFFLGLGKLIHISAGLNGTIIVTSKYYYFGTIFMLLLAVFTLVTNYLLIPDYGIVGAALATAISLVVFNIIAFSFLLVKFKLQPFNIKTLMVLVIGVGAYFLADIINISDNLVLNQVVQSLVLVAIYIPLILIGRVSPDINNWVNKMVKLVTK